MTTGLRGLLASALLLAGAATARADQGTTEICGRVLRADDALLEQAGELLALGDPFSATLVTEGPGASCSGGCGTLRSQSDGHRVTGNLTRVPAPGERLSATAWSAEGTLEASRVGRLTGLTGTLVATITGDRSGDLGSIHPNFSDSDPTLGGIADIILAPRDGGPTGALIASIDQIGSACSELASIPPYWGFPLIGIGVLASSSYLLRRRI